MPSPPRCPGERILRWILFNGGLDRCIVSPLLSHRGISHTDPCWPGSLASNGWWLQPPNCPPSRHLLLKPVPQTHPPLQLPPSNGGFPPPITPLPHLQPGSEICSC